jgi:hypothetical protein
MEDRMLKLMPTHTKPADEKAPLQIAPDALAAAIADVEKPARLANAERLLIRARERHASASAAERGAIAEYRKRNPLSTASLPPEIRALSEDLRAAEALVKQARTQLAEERAQFTPTFLDALAGPVRDIAAAIMTHVIEVERLIEALAGGRRAAERNGVEAPRLLANTYALRDAVADIRRTIGR